jgi:hypothetical protein
LHGAIPPPASAENLQENFSSRLNKGLSTNGLAGRQDLQQVAAGDLLLGNASRSHEDFVDPGTSLIGRVCVVVYSGFMYMRNMALRQ